MASCWDVRLWVLTGMLVGMGVQAQVIRDLGPTRQKRVALHAVPVFTQSETASEVRRMAKAGGTLTAPLFIGEQNVWVDESGLLKVWLPDPNADGWDPTGRVPLVYRVKVREGCQDVWSTVVSAEAYPFVFTSDAPVNLDQYDVVVSRETAGANKDISPGTVIVGPAPGAVTSDVPEDRFAYDRWVMHLPRKSGGFDGAFVFANRFPETPAKIYLTGFDQDGQVVENGQRVALVLGPRAQMDLYGAEDEAVFPSELQDLISHVGLHEEHGQSTVEVSISYRHVEEGGLTATLPEADLKRGLASGSAFVVEARKSERFWDGVAILNLRQTESVFVNAEQVRVDDGTVLNARTIGPIGAGSKELVVLSSLFSYQPGTYYRLESAENDEAIQVMGLRGSNDAETPLLVGSHVFKQQ